MCPRRSCADLGNDPRHVFLNVGIEMFQASAKIIQSRLTVWRVDDPISGALAPAEIQLFTCAAVIGQRIALGKAKIHLLLRINHFPKMLLIDVSDFVFGVNVVIAGIDIPVLLDGECFAAELGRHGFWRS